MNSKKLISAVIAMAIILPSSAVYAKTPNFGGGLLKQQQNQANKAALQQYRSDISSKKDTVKQNNETNKNLRQAIAQKKATIKGLIQNIKQSGKQLNSTDLSSIQAELQTIDNDIASLQTLNGSIKQAYTTIKNDIKNKDYKAAESQFDSIIDTQNTRTTDLTNLSADMDKLISELQKAVSDSAAN